MRDRLIELLNGFSLKCFSHCDGKLHGDCNTCHMGQIADYLIENGVILPPCKVGDVVYLVCRSHFSKNASIREQKATHLKYINGYWYIDTDTHFDKEYGLSVFTNYEAAEKALRGEGE